MFLLTTISGTVGKYVMSIILSYNCYSFGPSRVKLGSIQPAKVTVLEQKVVEKRQFTMADLLPTEAPCQFGVKPAGRGAGSSLTARLPAGRGSLMLSESTPAHNRAVAPLGLRLRAEIQVGSIPVRCRILPAAWRRPTYANA